MLSCLPLLVSADRETPSGSLLTTLSRFGWSANRVMWVSPTIAVSFFGIGTVLMFMSVLNYLPDACELAAGRGSS